MGVGERGTDDHIVHPIAILRLAEATEKALRRPPPRFDLEAVAARFERSRVEEKPEAFPNTT